MRSHGLMPVINGMHGAGCSPCNRSGASMPYFFAPREARTTLKCPECGKELDIRRTCHEAYMQCSACRRTFKLAPFIPSMDKVMEEFLERLYADRV